MNVEIGTEATQFSEKEYINGIFVVMYDEQKMEDLSVRCLPVCSLLFSCCLPVACRLFVYFLSVVRLMPRKLSHPSTQKVVLPTNINL
jgi:hypothetical protein